MGSTTEEVGSPVTWEEGSIKEVVGSTTVEDSAVIVADSLVT